MSEEAARFYDILASTYEEEFSVPRRRLYDELAWKRTVQHIETLGTSLSILDAGAGLCRWSIRLAQMGHSVTAIDASAAMCEKGSQVVARANLSKQVKIIHADFDHPLPLASESFDLVISMGAFQYCIDPIQSLKYFHDVIVKKGLIILLTDGKYSRLANYLRQNDLEGFRRVLETGRDAYHRNKNKADHFVFSPEELSAFLERTGFKHRESLGFMVLPQFLPGETIDTMINQNFDYWLELENSIDRIPEIIGFGKQVMVVAQKEITLASPQR